jgi:hypothetical protein
MSDALTKEKIAAWESIGLCSDRARWDVASAVKMLKESLKNEDNINLDGEDIDYLIDECFPAFKKGDE